MKLLPRLLVFAFPLALLTLPVAAGDGPIFAGTVPVSETAVSADNVGMQPECPFSWAIARLKCKKGAAGAAVGEYGGTVVSLFCDDDKTVQSLCVAGFSYGVRVSSENDVAVDCFFEGNGVLHEACGDVQLTIN